MEFKARQDAEGRTAAKRGKRGGSKRKKEKKKAAAEEAAAAEDALEVEAEAEEEDDDDEAADEAAEAEAEQLRQLLQSSAEEGDALNELSADYEAALAQSLGQQAELIKEKQDAARLSIRARKATKIARAWVARRIRLEPEKDPLAAMYAERLNEYDEQLKSKDTKEGLRCASSATICGGGRVGPLHWSAQTDYTKNYRPFVVDVACPLIARLERTQLKVEETILGELDAERKEALAKLVVPRQVSRLKVAPGDERHRGQQGVGEVEEARRRAHHLRLCGGRCRTGGRGARRGRERVWDGGRRDAGARGGGGGDRG